MARRIFLGLVASALASGFILTAQSRAETSQSDRDALDQVTAMYEEYKRQAFPDVPDITVDSLVKLKEQGDVIVVDVREDRERRVSAIPGAISKKQFLKDRDQYTNKIVVSYCTIGYRSGLFTRDMIKDGFDARNLAGSILAWAHQGQPLIVGEDTTNRVHVYGKKWDLLPESHESVW